MHHEFRGLLNADFYDAVKNSNAQGHVFTEGVEQGQKTFSAVREVFPAPRMFKSQQRA
jgi:hypothetical protein